MCAKHAINNLLQKREFDEVKLLMRQLEGGNQAALQRAPLR